MVYKPRKTPRYIGKKLNFWLHLPLRNCGEPQLNVPTVSALAGATISLDQMAVQGTVERTSRVTDSATAVTELRFSGDGKCEFWTCGNAATRGQGQGR